MRTRHAIKNIITSLLLGIIVIIATFSLQRTLAIALGPEYLGINSLFTTTISMLTVAELGFGAAVIFHLYKPMKEKDWSRINVLMAFYRKVYRSIGFVVLGLGLATLPFLHLIVGEHGLSINIYIIFSLFLSAAVISYFMSYKRALLQADQKAYLIDIAYTLSYVTIVILQIVTLTLTHNYYLFLVGGVLLVISSNLIINGIVHRRYADLSINPKSKLDKDTYSYILKQVKGLILHKTSSFIVPGSSNVIISLVIGIKSVGLASNYLLISTAITTMTWKISTAVTASVGNLMVDAKKADLNRVYARLQFGSFALAAVVLGVLINSVDTFVAMWVGDQYVLGLSSVLPIAIAIYLTIIRIVPNSFKQAAGIFYEDRYVPIIEAVLNIIFSLILAAMFGLEGVFWGLALSTLFLHLYAYPKYVYVGVLSRRYTEYFTDSSKYLIATGIFCALAYLACQVIDTEHLLVDLILQVLVSVIVIGLLWVLLFARSKQAIYYIKLLRRGYRQIARRSSK